MAEPRLALLTGEGVSSLSTLSDLLLTEVEDLSLAGVEALSLAGVEAAIGISSDLSSSSEGSSLDCSSLTGFSLVLVSVDDSAGIVVGEDDDVVVVVVVSGPIATELELGVNGIGNTFSSVIDISLAVLPFFRLVPLICTLELPEICRFLAPPPMAVEDEVLGWLTIVQPRVRLRSSKLRRYLL